MNLVVGGSRSRWVYLCVGSFIASGCINNPVPVPTPGATPAKFVNFESPHVSPLALSSDGALLFAVNTPDNSVQVFDLSGGMPVAAGRIAVGLEPVSVRARTNSEIWVVNRISDSVSVVSVPDRSVVRTLRVGDEPGDVVFAGGRAFVSCLQPSRVLAYDVNNLDAPPTPIAIQAHDPRSMAVSADGSTVYVATFESGNHTTILNKHLVSDPDGPYAGQNPPPNAGGEFSPLISEDLPPPPSVGLIVRKDLATHRWLDDNGGDWSSKVAWDLHDHDVAVIDVASLSVSYISGLMNTNMHLAARTDGKLTVVGTEATNQVRFQPDLTGRFVHSVVAVVDPAGNDTPESKQIVDLNPHLAAAYEQKASNVAPELRNLSIADPRGIVWRSDGTRAFVTGMGTNSVIAIDAGGARVAQTDVGEGPTGIVLDEPRNQLYVLNRFEGSVSVLDADTLQEMTRVSFFDPTPPEIKAGRPFLYNARLTSGLGVTACGSCHIDARMDGLAWDLGNPAGELKAFNQTCDSLEGHVFHPICEDFHPMKGPMTTQSLQDIIGREPFHWRGDRENLAEFNPAFVDLLGADRQLTVDEMEKFRAFLATVQYPPSPNRNLDDSLRDALGNGSPVNGEKLFTSGNHDRLQFNCNFCHSGSLGSKLVVTPGKVLDGTSMKVPQLRGLYKKTGFLKDSLENDRGFGLTHDGSFSNVPDFLHFPVFTFSFGDAGEQERRDLEAFLMSFPTDAHPAIGTQVTLNEINNTQPEAASLVDLMIVLADIGATGLVVHGRVHGQPRGYAYVGGNRFQSDRVAEQIDAPALRSLAAPGAEQTWTVVPLGSQTRIGIDHNDNGLFDGDEPP